MQTFCQTYCLSILSCGSYFAIVSQRNQPLSDISLYIVIITIYRFLSRAKSTSLGKFQKLLRKMGVSVREMKMNVEFSRRQREHADADQHALSVSRSLCRFAKQVRLSDRRTHNRGRGTPASHRTMDGTNAACLWRRVCVGEAGNQARHDRQRHEDGQQTFAHFCYYH